MFTQLLWSNATAIGCGATLLPKNGYYWTEIVCNYAAGNMDSVPVYLNSTKAGSGCTTGTDTTYKALCSSKEPLDPNYNPSLVNSGSQAPNFTVTTDYCKSTCGSKHVGCNATDVSFVNF